VHRELRDGTIEWREGDAEVSALLIDALLMTFFKYVVLEGSTPLHGIASVIPAVQPFLTFSRQKTCSAARPLAVVRGET
jgi:hypothetical protein